MEAESGNLVVGVSQCLQGIAMGEKSEERKTCVLVAGEGFEPSKAEPEHPAAVEGCRPVSRGLMLELMTVANVRGSRLECRLAN